ncbi:MAG: dsbD [Lacunisphaera sp.]|nr:dsbD [Lacunisphaera sp.]MDB6166200.1 dsbD [Lacunisphaera sp.]
MKLSRLLLLPLFALPVLSFAAESSPVKKGAVTVSLVSDAATVEAGKPFTVALRMQHDPHWHSYWIAAGTGYPTSITWTLPDGFKAGDIQWPTPQILRDSSHKIVGNGYSDENLLLVEITPSATLAAGTEVKLAAAVEWLMCEDVCMPGDGQLAITFPTGPSQTDAKWTKAIADTRTRMPDAATGWNVSATHTDKTVTLRVTPKPGTKHQPADLHFFSADAYTDYEKPQEVKPDNGGWLLEMPLDAAADKATKRLTGVLASANGWSDGSGYDGLAIDVAFGDGKSAQPSAVSNQPSSDSQISSSAVGQAKAEGLKSQVSPPAAPGSLPATLALAFIGGVILNLMPCVFPVLGIKILGFVNQSGNDRKKITAHGLVFALGVLLSFWALAGVLLVLRAGGSKLGWGFQLQSPAFVFGMAVFLLVFALNLSGLFEVGLSATGVGGGLQMKEGFLGSFFTGALATLVATPCSAPFLAPALGAALALSAVQSFLVFTAIALGLALPYLLLSIFPQAIKFLPKPGAWMETFKQLMSFPLYATVGWLLWVLAAQTKDDDNALLLIAFGLVLVAMAAWAYGRFGQAHGKPARQTAGRVFAALLFVGGLGLGWPKEAPAAPADGSYQVTWDKWSPEAIAAAQAAGKFVYVDFTARWCATCQTNKAAVFHSDEVLAELKKKNVVLLRGDWTNRDPKITAELARWNRSAVPFNLIYGPGKAEPVILAELLTPDRVIAGFAEAAK